MRVNLKASIKKKKSLQKKKKVKGNGKVMTTGEVPNCVQKGRDPEHRQGSLQLQAQGHLV